MKKVKITLKDGTEVVLDDVLRIEQVQEDPSMYHPFQIIDTHGKGTAVPEQWQIPADQKRALGSPSQSEFTSPSMT